MKKVFGFTLVLALTVGYYLYDKNKSKVVEKTVVSQKWQTSMRKLLLMDYESLDCPKDSVQIKPEVTYLTTPFEKVCLHYDRAVSMSIIGGNKSKYIVQVLHMQNLENVPCSNENLIKAFNLDMSKTVVFESTPEIITFGSPDGEVNLKSAEAKIFLVWKCIPPQSYFEGVITADFKQH